MHLTKPISEIPKPDNEKKRRLEKSQVHYNKKKDEMSVNKLSAMRKR